MGLTIRLSFFHFAGELGGWGYLGLKALSMSWSLGRCVITALPTCHSNIHDLHFQNFHLLNGSCWMNLSKGTDWKGGSLVSTGSVQQLYFQLTWDEPFYPVAKKLKSKSVTQGIQECNLYQILSNGHTTNILISVHLQGQQNVAVNLHGLHCIKFGLVSIYVFVDNMRTKAITLPMHFSK